MPAEPDAWRARCWAGPIPSEPPRPTAKGNEPASLVEPVSGPLKFQQVPDAGIQQTVALNTAEPKPRTHVDDLGSGGRFGVPPTFGSGQTGSSDRATPPPAP